MQLYVWHHVLGDYTDGIVFALASSVEDARRVVLSPIQDDWERESVEDAIADEPSVYDSPVGFFVRGGG